MGKSFRDHHWYDDGYGDSYEDRRKKGEVRDQRKKKQADREQIFNSSDGEEFKD
mgnify:CR=1 FL=1